MAARYVLDLRKPVPPPMESESDRVEALQAEVNDLKQTQKILLTQITQLSQPAEQNTSKDALQRELKETKAMLAKLTEDHNIALKLICQLSSQLGEAPVQPSTTPASAAVVKRQNRLPINSNSKTGKKSLPEAHRDRIGEYYRSLDLPE